MKLKKCPKCELNYMPENQSACEVCRKMLHGTETELDINDIEVCPECGELYSTGGEMCPRCAEKLEEDKIEPSEIEDDFDKLANDDTEDMQ